MWDPTLMILALSFGVYFPADVCLPSTKTNSPSSSGQLHIGGNAFMGY